MNLSNYYRPPFVTVRGLPAAVIVTRPEQVPDGSERSEVLRLLETNPYVRLVPARMFIG
jgi:hypothetical protein